MGDDVMWGYLEGELPCGMDVVSNIKIGTTCLVHSTPQHDGGSKSTGANFCYSLIPEEEIIGCIGEIVFIDDYCDQHTTDVNILVGGEVYECIDICYLTLVG